MTDLEKAVKAAERLLRSRPALATSKGSFDRCKGTATTLARALAADGVEASVVRVSEGSRHYPDAHRRWTDLGSSFWWTHYVVQVGGNYVDLTARQFDPSAACPEVGTMDRLHADWAQVSCHVDLPEIDETGVLAPAP